LQYSYLSTSNPTNLVTGDFGIAHLSHWLLDAVSGQTSSTLSLERKTAGDGATTSRIWYDYDGKGANNNTTGTNALPSFVVLVEKAGKTHFTNFARGAHSQVLQQISSYTLANGSRGVRTNNFVYAANNIDLLQQVGPLAEQVISNYFIAGNTFHQPDASYDALNQATVYTYNAKRQVTSRKTPAGLTTTNIYFTSGTASNFLDKTIDLEINRTNSFTYTNGLVLSHTDERGLVTTNYWDALQRLIGTVYPVGSISNIYTSLDITATKDREGHWTYFGYNQIRQKIAETNVNGTVTRYGYCECGALTSLTNAWSTPVQQVTSFSYDFAGNATNICRPTAIASPTGSTLPVG
jgi:YD repeat-containing protein